MADHRPRKSMALVMIARNEARCIARCLDSVAPWVDQMIVLDTGSTDQTINIARQCGAEVYHFEWCDDFSAARNAALDHSRADWNLVLDADEWLMAGGPSLRTIAEQEAPFTDQNFVGAVLIESAFDNNQRREEASSWLTRLLPKGVRFEGSVHEQPIHQQPRKLIDLLIGHDGYEPQQLEKKKGRNHALLERALKAHPDDPYLHYQYGKECEVARLFVEAVKHYRLALKQADPALAWHHDLVVRMLFCLKMTGQFEEGMLLAQTMEAHYKSSPDFYFVLGDLLLDMALSHPQQAAQSLHLIEDCWLTCLKLGEHPEWEGAVKGRGSVLARHNLHVFYQSIGDEQKAKLYQPLPPV
jgi:tetratricopeptide (TPR) repeat protein